MYSVIGKIIANIGISLLTEKVLKEVFVHTGWYLAGKTTNKLDDSYVKTVADALGVKVDE